MKATYHHGAYPDLNVDWGDPVNEDLTGYTIALDAFPFGGATAFLKTTGFTIPPLVAGAAPSPNLVVAWDQTPDAELDLLPEGAYVLKFVATKGGSATLEMYGELIVRDNAPNFGYCEKSDLLLGDLTIAASVNLYDYINAAADEIDGEIGQRYLLPLDLTSAPAWVLAKLKDINAKLATGRYVTAAAYSGGLDHDLQAYGAAMIKRALVEVADIANGKVRLAGVPIDPTSFRVTTPVIVNRDGSSAVDAMTDFTQRRHWSWQRLVGPIWQPSDPPPGIPTSTTIP